MELYVVDSIAVELSQGKCEDCDGIIVGAMFPMDTQIKQGYEELVCNIREIDKEKCLYLYPFEHLHLTVATLSNFKHSGLYNTDTRKKTLETCEKMFDDLGKRIGEENQKTNNFLQITDFRVTNGAGIILYKDSKEIIQKVRDAITATITSEILPTLFIPNIIHTTFFRYIKAPTNSFINELKDVLSFHFSKSIWRASLELAYVCLIAETKPYMHVNEEAIIKKLKF